MTSSTHGKAGFVYRNALGEWDHLPSKLAAEGSDRTTPLVTIAIPTYRRADLVVESVQSALAQKFDRPFEIVVVDNDPDSSGAEALLEALPELKARNFRYYVNSENLGVFGNFNRAIQLTRGEWLTILNDDDLLEERFLSTMFSVLDRNPQIDGLSCRKEFFYDRADLQPPPRSLPRRIAARLLTESYFGGKSTRRVPARKFFWGPILGNMVGALYRISKVVEIGGFYPEEWPSDTWFHARFAARFEVRQHREGLARIRVSENLTLAPGMGTSILEDAYRFRSALAGGDAPRWWARFAPYLAAHHRVAFEHFYGTKVPAQELEEALKMKLPANHPVILRAFRLLLRGF